MEAGQEAAPQKVWERSHLNSAVLGAEGAVSGVEPCGMPAPETQWHPYSPRGSGACLPVDAPGPCGGEELLHTAHARDAPRRRGEQRHGDRHGDLRALSWPASNQAPSAPPAFLSQGGFKG